MVTSSANFSDNELFNTLVPHCTIGNSSICTFFFICTLPVPDFSKGNSNLRHQKVAAKETFQSQLILNNKRSRLLLKHPPKTASAQIAILRGFHTQTIIRIPLKTCSSACLSRKLKAPLRNQVCCILLLEEHLV